MTIAAFIAGLAVVVLIARKALQGGLLLNHGKKFITHNVSFTRLPSGDLRLKAKGGLLTDRFNITLPPSDIDIPAFAVGHRPKNRQLDKEGYKVYRLVCVQHAKNEGGIRTTVGDFTLKPKAQAKFEKFTSQLV